MGRIQGDLKERTLDFAVCILALVDELPRSSKGWVIGRQLVRSATSIGANVREADHAHTDADFAYKCSVARKEASETEYWLELCGRSAMLKPDRLQSVSAEAGELMRILATIVKRTQEHLS
jgi:four helix bundle protein